MQITSVCTRGASFPSISCTIRVLYPHNVYALLGVLCPPCVRSGWFGWDNRAGRPIRRLATLSEYFVNLIAQSRQIQKNDNYVVRLPSWCRRSSVRYPRLAEKVSPVPALTFFIALLRYNTLCRRLRVFQYSRCFRPFSVSTPSRRIAHTYS